MSRGLGVLQREIFDTLDEARHVRASYRGFGGESVSRTYGDSWPAGHKWTLPGWVRVGGNTVRIGMNVYDLRASCDFLATRHEKSDPGRIHQTFKASFSRAVAGLIKRGLLEKCGALLPLSDVDEDRLLNPERIHALDGGKYLLVDSRQNRFVTKRQLALSDK